MIVTVSPRAQRQADEIEAWLRARSAVAARRFREEMGRAIQRLAAHPWSGKVFRRGPTHRILLRRTRYHLYYVVDEARGIVRIRAVWHAARRGGPKLGR